MMNSIPTLYQFAFEETKAANRRNNRTRKMRNLLALFAIITAFWTLWFSARPILNAHISDEIAMSMFVALLVVASHVNLRELIAALEKRVRTLEANDIEVTQRSSPISLNEYGKSLSELVGAKALARNYAKEVVLSLPTNSYRIQEACAHFAEQQLLDRLTSDERSFLETIAYEEGINIEKVLRVVGIELRDYFLAQNEQKAG